MEYQRLRQYLQSPQPILYDPIGMWECYDADVREAPTNPTTARKALSLLPEWAQIISALTAAEMVLPIWEESEYAESLLRNHEYFAPRRAIETAWAYLRGEVEEEELPPATEAAYATTHSVTNASAHNAARTAAHASHAAYPSTLVATKVDTAVAAATAASYSTSYATSTGKAAAKISRENFYRLWWCNCKRRLAIFGLDETTLNWWV